MEKDYKNLNNKNEVMRVKKTITLSKDVVDWLEKEIKERRFSSLSHGIEFAVYQLMKKEKKE